MPGLPVTSVIEAQIVRTRSLTITP